MPAGRGRPRRYAARAVEIPSGRRRRPAADHGDADRYEQQQHVHEPDVPAGFAGTHRLFFVFGAVPGGSTTGLGNLNWVEFSGPGAGVNP
jgi:hypothetical protein